MIGFVAATGSSRKVSSTASKSSVYMLLGVYELVPGDRLGADDGDGKSRKDCERVEGMDWKGNKVGGE